MKGNIKIVRPLSVSGSVYRRAVVVPRQEFNDPALLVAADDGGECRRQVGLRIDGIELAGLDERSDNRPVLCSGIMPRKKCVLAIEGYGPDRSLDAIVVNLNTTVCQEDAKAVPEFGDIGECFAKRRLASDAGAMMLELGPHVGN